MFFSLKKVTIFFFCFFINIVNFYNSANLDNNLLSDAIAASLAEGVQGNGTNMHTCEAAGCSSYKNIIKDNSDDCLFGFICKKCKKTHAKSQDICFYSSLEGYENLYEGLLEDFSQTTYDTFKIPLDKKVDNISTKHENKQTSDNKEKEEKEEEEDEEDEKKDNSKKNKKEKSNSTKKEDEEGTEDEEEVEEEEEEEEDESDKKKNGSYSKNNDKESFLEQSAKNIYYNSTVFEKKNMLFNKTQFKKKFLTCSKSLEPDDEYNIKERTDYSYLEKNTEEKKIIYRRLKININKYEEYLKNKLSKCDVSDDGMSSIYIKLILQIVKDKNDIYTDISKKSILSNGERSNYHSRSGDDTDIDENENDDDQEENESDEEERGSVYKKKKENQKNEKLHFDYDENNTNNSKYNSNNETKYNNSSNDSISYENNQIAEPIYMEKNNSQTNQSFDYDYHNLQSNKSYSDPNLMQYSYIDLHNLKRENNNISTNKNKLNYINNYFIVEKNDTHKESNNELYDPVEIIKKEKMNNTLINNFHNNKEYAFYQYKIGEDLGGDSMENYYKSKNGFFKSIFQKVFKKKNSDDEGDDYDEESDGKKKRGFFSKKKKKKKKDEDIDNDEIINNEDEDGDEDDNESSYSGKGESKGKSQNKKKKKKSLFSKFKSKYFKKKQKLHIEAYFNNIIVKTCKNSLKWKGKMFRKHSLIEMTLKVPVKMKYIKNEPLNFFRSGYEVIITCKNCDEVLFNSCVQVYCTKKNSKLGSSISNATSNSSNLNTMGTVAFTPIQLYNYGSQNPADLYFMPPAYYSSHKNIYIKYSIVILLMFINLVI
ncbi:conserved Plasmodium protein, unknown function [Plasmodium gallinaceum]|uniref:Surface-related antigen SRA n=1 Tax=Plasmodium gallinaceum TaxID=5849 RepID=A0A1J1GTK7_PLAGA|nr:conserved Plasmodium protein, unknown function [Plasmodium gallinaceum]CRG95818.1 conserved Plasmodium protein, unknown function [Plasmodium gallinaceum]